MDAVAPSRKPPITGVRRCRWTRTLALVCAGVLLMSVPSCRFGRPQRTVEWVAGCVVPPFDPDGPPADVRWAIERLLSEGLTRERADGHVEGAAAARFEVAHDGLSWTFHLRPNLRYTDGHPCTSADFRAALAGGLSRTDHGTRAVLLAAVRGVRPARAGRARTPLGIETPDERTLVVRLDHPDSLLPLALSLPGVSTPWRSREPGAWSGAIGIGPYRLVAVDGARLMMGRASGAAGPDSVNLRFAIGAGRLRALMRARDVDLLWPAPPELCDQSAPAGYRLESSAARPARSLLLVMRADTPPTSHEEARRALAHGVHGAELLAALGRAAGAGGELVPGAGRFPLPRYDATEVAAWMEKGDLGRSFHVSLLYDADRAGGAAAPLLQGEWSRHNIDAELDARRGSEFSRAALAGNQPLVLVEWQPLERGASFVALGLIGATRAGACGPVRTGWRPADASALRGPGAPGRPAVALEAALERDLVALPLAGLPWVRLVRESGPPVSFHPHFGPDFASPEGESGGSGAAVAGALSH
jgi:hypothetical protein